MLKTVNKIFSFLSISFLIVAFTACNKEPVYTPESTSTTSLYDFWLEKTISNTSLNRPYQGMIMGDTAVHLTVDYGTNITALEPTVFTDADSISPKGKQNFTSPVKYTVWAKGKSASYTVRIIVSPIQFPTVKAIAAGFGHVLVLKTDGTVWACGDNSSGQLGLGDYSSRNKLTQVPVYGVDEMFTGSAASIIKLKDGTAWATGNQYGQLGLGNKNRVVGFTRVPFFDDASQFAITFSEVFVLKPDGTVWGAGRNLTKILAQGDYEPRSSFVKIPISGVKQLSGCANDIIVQKNDGAIWGWGLNNTGQLGLGDNLQRATPVLIPTASISVAKISASGNSIFLLDNNGKIWASGANTRGQLGLGDLNNRNLFTQVSFFNNKTIDAIITHAGNTSFKETNGNLWSVGDNTSGLMGLGSVSTLPSPTPLQMNNFAATSIAGYGGTAYAVKTDGSLWGWGANSFGALGTGGDSAYSSSPIQIK